MRAQTNILLIHDIGRSVLGRVTAQDVISLAYNAHGWREPPPARSIAGFTGQPAEAVAGWYLLGNGQRVYNPALMRFQTPDSLSPFGRGGLNAYAYCAGDPVNRHDPTGQFSALINGVVRSAVKKTFAASGVVSLVHRYLKKEVMRIGDRLIVVGYGMMASGAAIDIATPLTMGVARSSLSSVGSTLSEVGATIASAGAGLNAASSALKMAKEIPVLVRRRFVTEAQPISVAKQLREGARHHVIDIRS